MTRTQLLRGLGLARVAVGTLWLAGLATGRPGAGARLPAAGRTAATALAVRDLAQGSWLVVQPGPPAAEAGAVIDVLHGVSMLPLVVLAPRYRTAAAVSAGAATGWALAAAWLLSRPQVSAGRGVASGIGRNIPGRDPQHRCVGDQGAEWKDRWHGEPVSGRGGS